MIDQRYVRREQIGSGGMSRVWLGHDTLLDRPVALKELGHAPGAAEPDTERAEREAQLTATVRHPNVVVVYDVVEQDSRLWLVMEHVDGDTLSRLCLPRGLPTARVAHLLAPVADALATAHAQDVVHRDVKPSNILVGTGDVAKLGDFGVARRGDDAVLTRTGLISGSPGYVAPEVALGRPANAASDVWAFGATLYQACTGRTAFDITDDPIQSLENIVRNAPPCLPDAHPLATIVADALNREPEDRPTMRMVADHLEQVQAEQVDTAPSAEVTPIIEAPRVRRRKGGAHAGPRRPSPVWQSVIALTGTRRDDEPTLVAAKAQDGVAEGDTATPA